MIRTFRYENAAGGSVTLDYAHGYVLSKPDGIDTVSVNLATAQGIGQIGATVQAKSIQTRPMTFSGVICGEDQSAAKDALQRVIRPDLAGTIYADDLKLDVAVVASPVIGALANCSEFQFQLVAPYPFWQNTNRSSVQLTGVQGMFRFPWKICASYQFGQRVAAQFMNIENRGQADCPMTITIDALAAATNPKLENILTGEFLQIEKILSPAERLVVNITHDRTYATSSMDGDCRGAITLDSNLFRLHVGDNVIKPTAESGLDKLEIAVAFAPEQVGVTL